MTDPELIIGIIKQLKRIADALEEGNKEVI